MLRHLARGHGDEVMGTTLMADELKRAREGMERELGQGSGGGGGGGDGGDGGGHASLGGDGGDVHIVSQLDLSLVREYNGAEAKLSGTDSDSGLGAGLR